MKKIADDTASDPTTDSSDHVHGDHVHDHGLAAMLLAITLLVWAVCAGLLLVNAALPAGASGSMVAVFAPGTPSGRIYRAVLAADGRLVNSTALGTAWVVHSDRPGFVERLQAQGAWAAFKPSLFRPLTVSGCFLVAPEVFTPAPRS